MVSVKAFYALLRSAIEFDHDGLIYSGIHVPNFLNEGRWLVLKIHRSEYSSNSGRHRVEVTFPPFFQLGNWDYYVIKSRYEFNWKEIDEKGVRQLCRLFKLGAIIWSVSRGFDWAIICEYKTVWDDDVDELLVELIADSIKQ